ncbi:unnamed protein product [Closterium sp. NIES-53]
MAGNTSAGAGESSAQDRSGSQDSGVSAPRGARTNQGSLIKEVLKNFTVEKFNGEGYDDWAWKMKLYFREIGLLKLMIGEEPRPSDPALEEEWDERALAGYYLMSQSLELNQRHHVMHLLPEVDSGPKAWTMLKELHAPTSVVATLMLERELSALRLSEGEPVQPVLDKMRDLFAKLATAGITYPEQTKCLKMLSLLPESWLRFTSGLSLPQNQSLWTLEWVRKKILEEDFRRRQLRGGDDGSSGYGMQGSRRDRGRSFGGAGRSAQKDDDSNDQQGGTGWGRGAKSGRGGKSDAAVSGKFIIQMDISTAFLNGILEEDVYMTQPPGYEDGTGRVCKLKKSIYGLKQAPRCWYQKLAAVLEEMGFRTSSCDESLFLKGEGEKLVLFLVYVDDILLFSSSMKEIQNVQQQLMKNFKCKTLGEVKYYLGMHVERDLDHRWLKLHQEKFIKELGEKYGIENERKVATPLPAEFKLVKAAKDEGVEAEEQQQFQSLVGITYPEQTKCLKMLSLLPESWLQLTSELSLPQNQS